MFNFLGGLEITARYLWSSTSPASKRPSFTFILWQLINRMNLQSVLQLLNKNYFFALLLTFPTLPTQSDLSLFADLSLVRTSLSWWEVLIKSRDLGFCSDIFGIELTKCNNHISCFRKDPPPGLTEKGSNVHCRTFGYKFG